jgi:hypothetical protein
LLEIEERLEEEFLNSKKYLRIIGDIDLSSDDYKYLILKIKGLTRFSANISICETYKLSLLTACVFSIKKEQENQGSIESLRTMYRALPQHHMRYFRRLCKSTLEEYGMSTFQMDTRHFDGLFSILLAHAGIPENLHAKLYDILDESLKIGQRHVFELKIRDEFMPKIDWIAQYMNPKYLEKVFLDSRDLLIDCKINELPHNELFEKYNHLSSKLILSCIKWRDEYEYIKHEQSKQLI